MAGISHCLNIHAPLKHKLFIERPKNLWYNAKLAKSKQTLRKIERIYRKTKTMLNKSIFTKQTKIHNENLKYARSKFYISIINDAGHDMKKLYKISNKLLGRTIKKKRPEKSPYDNARDFSIFFIEKVDKIIQSLTNNASNQIMTLSMNKITLNDFQCPPIDTVITLLKKTNKTCKLDNISLEVFKGIIMSIAPMSYRLFKNQFNKTPFQSHLKNQ